MNKHEPRTFGDRILDHVKTKPDAAAFVFYRRHDDVGAPLSWRELWTQAAGLAKALPLTRPANDSGVMIFCDDEKNFVVGLLAVWMAGAVAIPAVGGMNGNLAIRNQHIFRCARPDIVLHDLSDKMLSKLHTLVPEACCFAMPDVHTERDHEPEATPEFNTRLLQFTSGSTLDPKPILLQQEELAAGCRAIQNTFGLSQTSVGLHWLPLYHDMGLIGAVVQPMFTGATSVLLRPSIFIQRPLCWLELASKWRATITSAPNFAYETVCNAAEQAQNLDLSALTSVIMGGETVRKSTVDRIIATFGRFGLRLSAIAPSYGMAEATLLVSSGRTEQGPKFSHRDSGPEIVSLGPAVQGLHAEVRCPDTGAQLPDGAEGEFWLDGLMTGRVIGSGEDWRKPMQKVKIRTGDIGFFKGGALYVTGRTSSRMIIRGKNISAEDVEAVVLETLSCGETTGVAAFGIETAGTEELCILVELTARDGSLDLAELNRQIVTNFGIKPETVMAVRRLTLPRTTSGKIRRAAVRANFEAGHYKQKARTHAG